MSESQNKKNSIGLMAFIYACLKACIRNQLTPENALDLIKAKLN